MTMRTTSVEETEPGTADSSQSTEPSQTVDDGETDSTVHSTQIETNSAGTGHCRLLTFEELVFNMESAEFTMGLDNSHRGNMTEKTRRIHCIAKNISAENVTGDDYGARVDIVNSTQLLVKLGQMNETQGNCALVLFYAPWCMFCARAAPHYNALARAFPQLDVLAIDAVHFSNLNSRYGTIAVPNILVFHNAKAVARFNSSSRTFEDMVSFVTNVTGLAANQSVSVALQDYHGPLHSVPTNDRDLLLWLSWLFVMVFSTTVFAKSSHGQHLCNLLSNLGAEPQHIE